MSSHQHSDSRDHHCAQPQVREGQPLGCGGSCRAFEKHGTAKHRSWRKLHIGIDAGSGEIVAFDLTDKDVDDASNIEPLLDQLADAPASFMADGAYDRSTVLDAVLTRNANAKFIVPPCKGAVPRPTVAIAPTQRDLHVLAIDAHGRANWQKASGYNKRSKVEAAMSLYKRVIGDTLKSRNDARRVTEVAIAVKSLNRMRDLGQAICVRVTCLISRRRQCLFPNLLATKSRRLNTSLTNNSSA